MVYTLRVFRHTIANCAVYSYLKYSSQKMESNRKHFLVIIFYNFWGGLTQQHCIEELNPVLKMKLHQAPGELCEGRPKSAVVPETIDTERKLIYQDRHVPHR